MSKLAVFARNLRPLVAQQSIVALRICRPSTATFLRKFSAGHGHDDHGHGHDDHHDAHHDPDVFLDPKMVTERVITVIGNFEKVTAIVTATSRYKEDLDLDSLDAVEVVMALEDEFMMDIPDSEAEKFFGIPDVVEFISKHPMAK